MYKVIVRFVDLQDNSFKYNVGDTFPRAGKEVSEERLEELSTAKNRRKMALIQKVEEEVKPVEEKAEEVEEQTTEIPKEEAEVVKEEKPKKATPKKSARSTKSSEKEKK